MGANILLPPANNKESLNLGIRNSVEAVCLPYKLNLGNYIQALEGGANVLLMFRAPGTCRLGNYAPMAESKLRELGYDFEMIMFDMYKGKLAEISKKFAQATGSNNIIKTLYGIKLGFSKFDALDIIERKLFSLRPREINPGKAERIYKAGVIAIDNAMSVKEVKETVRLTLDRYNSVKIDKDKDVLKVYLTGEFFVLLDSFSNMEIEKELGLLGIEVERQIMLSDWTNTALLPKWMHKNESHRERAVRVAKSYIKRAIGGECIETIGDAIFAAKENVDGVVHIGPFTCNPEIISQCILPQVSRSENIPVISLTMDEHQGKAGLITRVEAFADLLYRRKRAKMTA
jgi:predicted nucleotide-binding protein (sugar kinase/HSP70/actin superfamily)